MRVRTHTRTYTSTQSGPTNMASHMDTESLFVSATGPSPAIPAHQEAPRPQAPCPPSNTKQRPGVHTQHLPSVLVSHRSTRPRISRYTHIVTQTCYTRAPPNMKLVMVGPLLFLLLRMSCSRGEEARRTRRPLGTLPMAYRQTHGWCCCSTTNSSNSE